MNILRHSFASFLLTVVILAVTTRAEELLWTNRTSPPTANNVMQVITAGGNLIAVGNQGTLLTSTDAITWTPRLVPTPHALSSVAYGNGRYIAVDVRRNIFRSTDAIRWTRISALGTASQFDAISQLVAGNNVFVAAVRGGPFWFSTDGETWQRARSDSGADLEFSSQIDWGKSRGPLLFVDGKFHAAGSGGVFWSSADGKVWTSSAPAAPAFVTSLAAGNGRFVAARGDAGVTYTLGDGTTVTGGGHFTSTDGIHWTAHTSPQLEAVNYVHGQFYARAALTQSLLQSSDGQSWNTLATPAPAVSLLEAIEFGTGYVTLSSESPSRIHTSSVGIAWHDVHETSPATGPVSVAYGNGTYVGGGLISADSRTWENGGFSVAGGQYDLRPVFSHDRFFFFEALLLPNVVNPAPRSIYASLDGRTGVKVLTTPTLGSSGNVVYGNGRFVMAGGGVHLSVDGLSWTVATGAPSMHDIAFGNGLFAGLDAENIYTSSDGATWTKRYSVPPRSSEYPIHSLTRIAYGRSRFMVIQTYLGKVIENSGMFTVTSLDGVTWTGAASNLGSSPSGFAFVNDVFILTLNGGRWDDINSHYIAQSIDGYSWEYAPAPTYGISSIAGANGTFVAANREDIFQAQRGSVTSPFFLSTSLSSATLHRGESRTFSVEIGGTGPLAYQWRRNGVPIAGAYSSTYIVSGSSAFAAGTYDVAVSGIGGTVVSSSAVIIHDDAWLANVSSRAHVGTGEDVLIQGFVLRNSTATTPVLARAIGPSLVPLGVSQAMGDPKFELHRSSDNALVGANDNWTDGLSADAIRSTFRQVGAFDLPADSKDASLIINLANGAYTFPVTNATGGTGIVLSELYDAETAGPGRLVNLSARARVGAGERTLIAGFVVAGGKSLNVLIRAVGPGLASMGVNAPLSNPRLILYGANSSVLGNNDDWGQNPNVAALRTATTATGAFALSEGSKDSAILVTLDPGIYTVHVTSVDASSGVALVEIYEAP